MFPRPGVHKMEGPLMLLGYPRDICIYIYAYMYLYIHIRYQRNTQMTIGTKRGFGKSLAGIAYGTCWKRP